MTLVDIFKEIGHFGSDIGCNDKGGQHSYLETYDKLFAPFRSGCTMMEIGLASGDSIKLWDRYFDNSGIVGIDLSIVFKPDEYRNRVDLIAGDATEFEILDKIKSYEFDIIIDDGSHMEEDQITTFNLLKHKMKKGGLYIIEDILSIDSNRQRFLNLWPNTEIVDLRKVKNRFDDVLIILRF